MTSTRAAIDCGTNSTRLLISGAEGETLERRMTITRLGQGVDATGRFDPESVDRTLAELRVHRDLIERHGVESLRVIATSAARDAANRDLLFEPATEILGRPLELIDGEEEAALTFRGAVAGLTERDGPFLVVDIGGGSTEFALGTTACESSISLDLGCVRLTERYLLHDPPRAEELSAAISLVEAHLDDVFLAMPAAAAAGTAIGVAGTISAVAAVEIGLAEYDRDAIHHFPLGRPAVEDVFRTLATEALVDRVHNPGLEPERAEVIVGGLCVLVAIMRRFGLDEILVSESDILDGIVAELP